MRTEIDSQLDRLREIVRGFQSCLVAYSGGVDSALVLAIAREQLGKNVLACIGVSPSLPKRECLAAARFAEQLGVRYRLIEPAEHLVGDYVANHANRCYFCKSALFDALRSIAIDEGWHAVVDGTHLDDVSDHVHGIRAATERAVHSPLLDARLTKHQVRMLARALQLPVWDKPAMACLASRIPHGTPVTPELLHQIEAAEDILAAEGFVQFRVRHHGELARIELRAVDLPKAMEQRERIVTGIRSTGYRYVTLDLEGFRDEATSSSAKPITLTVTAGSHRTTGP